MLLTIVKLTNVVYKCSRAPSANDFNLPVNQIICTSAHIGKYYLAWHQSRTRRLLSFYFCSSHAVQLPALPSSLFLIPSPTLFNNSPHSRLSILQCTVYQLVQWWIWPASALIVRNRISVQLSCLQFPKHSLSIY